MMVLLNTPEDMKWLRDVHLRGLPPEYETAVIHGNEDFPTQIEVYRSANPTVDKIPVIFVPDPDGSFKVQI
jgi:hypothetical protein